MFERWGLLFPVLAIVSLAGCGASGSQSGSSQEHRSGKQTAIRAGNNASQSAAISGRIHGDPASGCLWLDLGDGAQQSVVRQILVYGPYTVTWNPLRLYREGRQVAADGDLVNFAGGLSPGTPGVTGCPVKDVGLLSVSQ